MIQVIEQGSPLEKQLLRQGINQDKLLIKDWDTDTSERSEYFQGDLIDQGLLLKEWWVVVLLLRQVSVSLRFAVDIGSSIQ
jgi:hypothetical protein